MPIRIGAYNRARAILVNAGSHTASLAHDLHGRDDAADYFGRDLLSAARDDFHRSDRGQQNLHSEMTQDHYAAIHAAADEMGINEW